MGVGAEPPPPPLPLALPAAPLPPAPELPAALAMLADVDSLSLGESGSRDTGVLCIGTRRGQQVAIKLRALPPSCTGGDGSDGSAAGGGLGGGGGGAQPGPTADPPQLTLEAAALLQHPHLVEVYDVRQAAMDERTMDELFPPPGLRPGWPLHRSQRPSGRLQKFLAAHGMDLPPPPPAGTSLRCSGAASASLTIRPGTYCLRRRRAPPRIGPCSVVAVFMEHCEAGNLGVAACARPSPFLASPSWSLRVAQRSLLRTAREMASGLRTLHAAGLAHGSLRPSNVLLAAARADRRGFVARLADAGSTGLAASAANPLSLRPPALVMVAPEALIGSGVLHSPAADVYAFGMLLYLMAAGEMPFQGQHLVPVLMAVASGELAPDWPVGQHGHLAPLFARCIAHNPHNRPTADEVYNETSDLEAVVKAKPKRGGTAATAVSAGQGSATGVSAAALQADP
ncbi:hypothetical protein HYH03_008545 [Edaphochlamys debaryana]|uniref:Protein kinase domain-containing protein n=1 Tax=Edaphochlamys debaryana TaxID=47281 RepID=A0A835Y2W7_9CHLO|nr:hypothetical protein HYH03_008545 [Edaphochlamys debaryana]|eukprot:KAG2493116.1 hypothetical protein HYH03_008545 [Edaphochlamys debaryana]